METGTEFSGGTRPSSRLRLATRRRSVVLAAAAGALMAVGAVAWACTPGQMYGQLWLTGPTGANVVHDAPSTDLGNLGECPDDSSLDNMEREFTAGDVACVQAKNLWRRGTGSVEDDDGEDMMLYELKYTAAAGDDMLCHDSPATLPNLDTDHGLYEARADNNHQSWNLRGGWEDQRTVLTMPGGSYTVCAASVPSATTAAGYFDNGPDDDGNHLSITIVNPESD